MSELPVLWHIRVSHYNEKVRWALDRKGIAHRRRAPAPGVAHIAHAFRLTRGFTFPVLQIDGRAIRDSTRIIAELERLRPDPPLYPADPEERRRALALEEFFDTELGPHIRRVAFDVVLDDPERALGELARGDGVAARLARAGYPALRPVYRARYRVNDASAREGLARMRAALERIEAERAGGDHLVGDSFTVADLTAAAMFAPLVQPDELEYGLDLPPGLEPVRRELREHPGGRWVMDTYRRHRGSSAEVGG
jgi:glutathione S-transferase